MVSGVEIIGFVDTDTVLVEDALFGFCNVFTNNTFIGWPLALVVCIMVGVPDPALAEKNCCGLKLNLAVLV